MKVLKIFRNICHYAALAFIAIGALAGLYVLYYLTAAVAQEQLTSELGYQSFNFAFFGFVFLIIGLVLLVAFIVLDIVYKAKKAQAQPVVAPVQQMNQQPAQCCCECGCEKECEEKEQPDCVEEVLRWRDLYVEGIITEREFIDKRNEILDLDNGGPKMRTSLDDRIDEVMRWKKLYKEGVITEKEFIDKRDAILEYPHYQGEPYVVEKGKKPVRESTIPQCDEVLRWRDLYVEGIITDREFIDKRNEILQLDDDSMKARNGMDSRVEDIIKWKKLYTEGIITEREFIDKRNEMLGIDKDKQIK